MANLNPDEFGRDYFRGKCIGKDLRQLIILDLLENGADDVTGRIPKGQQQATSEKLRVSSDTVRIIWQRYVEDGT